MMRIQQQISFESIALRQGTITIEQLRRAYGQSRQRGESLEAALVRKRTLSAEQVASVYAARRTLNALPAGSTAS